MVQSPSPVLYGESATKLESFGKFHVKIPENYLFPSGWNDKFSGIGPIS
jgi:hypothetical protein